MKNILSEIKEDKERLVLCFPGVGSAFAKKHFTNSLIIGWNGKAMLVDAGAGLSRSLDKQGINYEDFDYFHFTHSHEDHVGDVQQILYRHKYLAQRKPKILITREYRGELWDNTLRGGARMNEYNGRNLVFEDYAEFIHPDIVHKRPIYNVDIDGLNLRLFKTIHEPGGCTKIEEAFWCNGLVIEYNDKKILWSGDTTFDPNMFMEINNSYDYAQSPYDAIFHDCDIGGYAVVHASYKDLLTMDNKNRIHLMHYGDDYETVDAIEDGFAGFTKEWEIFRY